MDTPVLAIQLGLTSEFRPALLLFKMTLYHILTMAEVLSKYVLHDTSLSISYTWFGMVQDHGNQSKNFLHQYSMQGETSCLKS